MKTRSFFVLLAAIGLTHSISFAQKAENQNPYAIFGSKPYVAGEIKEKEQPKVFVIENLAEDSTVARLEHDTETGLVTSFDKEGNAVGQKKLRIGERAWPTQDRYARKYPSSSPYVYCLNNPIKYMDPTGDTLTAAQEYFRDLLILSLREAFGEQKAGYFGFDENYNLTLSISAANFVTGLDANQKAAFLGLNALIGHSQKVNLYYGNEIIADDGTILDINKYGGGVYLVTPYERAIIIGWNPPTINVILETAEFREVHQNRTSVLFHEIGEWLHGEDNRAGNNYRGSVIDFENTIRPTLGLPSRPYDVEHASQVPTIYR